MKSNESFIEDVLNKEKIRRAEIRAAKKRTVGICSSLALLLVILVATPTVTNMFSAHKSFAPESNTAADGIMMPDADVLEDSADNSVVEVPEAPSEGDCEEGSKGNANTLGNGDVNSEVQWNDEVPEEPSDGDYAENLKGNGNTLENEGANSDEQCDDEAPSGSSDEESNEYPKEEEKPATDKRLYVIAALVALAACTLAAVLIICSKKNNKNII